MAEEEGQLHADTDGIGGSSVGDSVYY